MPQKATILQQQKGETEQVGVMLLSEASEAYVDGSLEDAIVIVIPDTGASRFNPTHETKDQKQSKATFIVAELGSGFAGEAIAYRQSKGDVQGLPLSVKLSVIAQPPNRKATTVNEALNRQEPESESELIPDSNSNGDAQVLSA